MEVAHASEQEQLVGEGERTYLGDLFKGSLARKDDQVLRISLGIRTRQDMPRPGHIPDM